MGENAYPIKKVLIKGYIYILFALFSRGGWGQSPQKSPPRRPVKTTGNNHTMALQ